MPRQHGFSDRVADLRAEAAGAGGGWLAAVDSRRIPPPPAVAWLGAREARDGDGGRGGRADAGRALREAGPEAAQARSDRDERTPRNGPRGRVRRGVRPTQPPGSRRSRTCAPPGLPLREGTASAKTGSEMRGEERGGARTRMESRAGGGEGGLHAAEPTSAARPPRPGFAERPRISERRPWEPGAGRAGATASLLAQVEALEPDAPAVAVAAGGVEEALARRLELRREARKAERLRRLRPDDLERQRHGDGLDGLLADGTVHGAARPRGRGPCNALPAAAGRGRGGLAR